MENIRTILLKDFSVIEQIYESHMKNDFPANERKPLAIIRKAMGRGRYDCYGMFEGNDLKGYAFFVKLPIGEQHSYLLDYLAVVDGCRGQGCGTILLKQLTEIITDAECIICEVEDPDHAKDPEERMQRERRLEFYLRNGYRLTEVTAYVFGMEYRLLEVSGGKEHTVEEIREYYSDLYRKMVPAPMYYAFVKIR